MRRLIALTFLFALVLGLCTCNKRPEGIAIKLYNPFYDQGIAGSEIVLVEIHENTITKNYECKALLHVTMDSQGEGFIDGAKLKKRANYTYVLRASKAYDVDIKNVDYPGILPEDKVLPKINGTMNIQVLYVPPFRTGWVIKIVNLNSDGFGSSPSDSISVRINQDFGYVEGWNNQYNGSKFNGSKNEVVAYLLKSPYPPNHPDTVKFPESAYFNIHFGKHNVKVVKRKSDVVTTTTYSEVVLHDEFIHEFVVKW
jgi:hypothetical protein